MSGERTIQRLNPAKNPVLGNLPPEAIDSLMASAELLKLQDGDVFIREGEPTDSLYFLTWGEVAILKGEAEIDRSRSGAVLGEMGVVYQQPRSASIKCVGEVEVLKVMAADFLRVVDGYPTIWLNLLRDQMYKVTSSQNVRREQQSSIEKAENMLGRIVSPQVREKVLKATSPDQLLKGTLNEAAILFFDIKGFSSAAEKMPPDVLLRVLNEHIAIIDQAVTRHEGLIANYIGDAILAVFNCPVEIAAPGAAAVNCYLQARTQLDELRQQKKNDGDLFFELGAGINFGEIVSGAIGTEDRFNFTILGDEVNLAARLEGLTRQYPVEVILAESCVRRLPRDLQQQVVRMDRVQVKGRKNPENIYAMTRIDAEQREAYERALDTYLKGRFAEAALGFSRVNHPLAAYLRNRCSRLQTEETGAWPGHYSWLVK